MDGRGELKGCSPDHGTLLALKLRRNWVIFG